MKLIRRTLLFLGPDILLLGLFTMLWMCLVVIYGGKIHFVEGSTVLPSIIVVALLVFTAVSHGRAHFLTAKDKALEKISFYRRLRRILRDWLPLIALIAVYETLRDYTGVIRPDSIDSYLLTMDVYLLGVEPTLWIQQFISPFWTDYFAFMYMLYFILPMFVATLLYVRGRTEDFRELVLGCVLCMYGGYILYLIFPAGPPRFFEGLNFEPKALTGLFGFYEFTQGKMDTSPHVMHKSSFPSLHCALSMLAFLHAFRFGDVWRKRLIVCINGLIAVSIWIATVYLRHHWAVDMIAGWILALSAFYLASFLRKFWSSLEKQHHQLQSL